MLSEQFRPFLADEDSEYVRRCHESAGEKLQTLYPGKRMVSYDDTTIGIATDSLYCPTGYDNYRLGIVDEEQPAMQRESDGEIIRLALRD